MRNSIKTFFILASLSALSACGTSLPLDEIQIIDRRSFSGGAGGSSADSTVNESTIDQERLQSIRLGRKPAD